MLIRKLWSYLRLAAAYVRFNWKSQLEYRGAFVWQAGAMFLNNGVWLAFWWLFFNRFPVVQGWEAKDIVTLWGIAAGGFGIAHAICGNALHLPGLIARGQIDSWMLYPRALLSHIIVGRMSATAVGDAIFGFVVYIVFVRPDAVHLALFTALTLSVALLFVGFSIMSGSLSFYLGNAEGLAEQWRFATVTFSTYPSPLFEGGVKILLYTVIPAAFVAELPVAALRHLSLSDALLALGGAVAVTAFGVAVFYNGLRGYESGNLMEMRG